MMIHIMICDDQKECRNIVRELLCEYSVLRDIEIDCTECASAEELMQADTGYDLLVLDYKLGEKNGLDAAKQLRKKGSEAIIIVLTSFDNIVFSVFEINAFRFLLKPVDKKKFFKALDDFAKVTNKNEAILIKIGGSTEIIRLNLLIYAEGDGKGCVIHIKDNQPLRYRATLTELEKQLPDDRFFRCHRSFCINMKYVKNYSAHEISLTDGTVIPMGRNKLNDFKTAHIDFSRKYGF